MNGRKAKKLREVVYENDNYREREYGQTKHGQIINMGQTVEIEGRSIAKRRIYQYLKKVVRHSKISNIEKQLIQ